ncbi:hypothetical protein [Paenibacillus ihuae]|uniref:hypothetical protein n=1 Tax=Paenibacillus ihuae TaxID=1232431 RepID=UPI0006D5A690|nr:hypothetical protein [Paenibacillus ihuae]
MNAQMMDQLFVESYLMMNLEITFTGVRSWFEMGGIPTEDIELFGALLFPDQIRPELQSEITRMIVYRHEDVFFQVSRTVEPNSGNDNPKHDIFDPVHQLLLRCMNVRSLSGVDDAVIDLGIALHKDMARVQPLYPTLHGFFQAKE